MAIKDHEVKFLYHRGLSKKDMEPVTGYVWVGADHVFITPHNLGIDFDEKEDRIKAPAVEVWPDTVSPSMGFDDDGGRPLFDGDLVDIGDNRFELRLNDKSVMDRLESREREKYGLKLALPNCHDFEPLPFG